MSRFRICVESLCLKKSFESTNAAMTSDDLLISLRKLCVLCVSAVN
jgi:hypothetical protein